MSDRHPSRHNPNDHAEECDDMDGYWQCAAYYPSAGQDQSATYPAQWEDGDYPAQVYQQVEPAGQHQVQYTDDTVYPGGDQTGAVHEDGSSVVPGTESWGEEAAEDSPPPGQGNSDPTRVEHFVGERRMSFERRAEYATQPTRAMIRRRTRVRQVVSEVDRATSSADGSTVRGGHRASGAANPPRSPKNRSDRHRHGSSASGKGSKT